MGSYLSEPVTEKESTDDSNDKLICGASYMQGWRVSQEDAHNCILDFDKDASLFAVYDGHGGHEVAQYCSQKLPQFIKDTAAYKDGLIDEALISGFLGFDSLIAQAHIVEVLKDMAKDKEADEESDEEENVDNLYEEAAMPIEQVIEKYTSNLVNPAVRNLKNDVDKFPKSPFLKAKKECDEIVGTSAGCSSSGIGGSSSDQCGDGVSSSTEPNSTTDPTTTNGSHAIPEIKISSADSSDMKETVTSSPDSKPVAEVGATQNGEVSTPDSEAQAKNDVSSSSTPPPHENGQVAKKGKGKALMKHTSPTKTAVESTRPKRNATQIYKEFITFSPEEKDKNQQREDSEESDDDDDDDEDDQTFEGPNEDSSDGDDDDGVNTSIEIEGSEDDPDTSEDEDDDDEDTDDLDEEGLAFARNMKEEPGSDSGCTAVVALLKDNKLYVANAGDSRCIVCRNGKAVEMSFDHKPEDEPEKARIEKAGGRVTGDGRVNGGLNLSRAIGDHAYKQNKQLSDKEQMITALPDVKQLTIAPNDDEFMVLACDGIWNYMSSQEVVEFVKPRIDEGVEKLSQICEELFDHCLAPNTMGDGTGCDNMTAVIVRFKHSASKKRAGSPVPCEEEGDSKKAKTDESDLQIDTTV